MRLIDVTDLKKFIRENVCAIGDDHLLLVAGDDGRWHEALPLVKTAYSVDKAVEELSNADPQEMMSEEQRNVLNYAIEIVKQGYVGTETETIRDKAVKWNNNSSKRVPYEFIDYVEGKRNIGVSDDVCEWKLANDGEFIQNPHTKRLYSNEPSMKNVYCNTCGKKIKVVE